MCAASAEEVTNSDSHAVDQTKNRFPAYGSDPKVLADIYRKEINIAIWQRQVGLPLNNAVNEFLAATPNFKTSMSISPEHAHSEVSKAMGDTAPPELADDVAKLVDMFCYLFGLKRAGLRLATLDRAMCPRFHVDKVPCRLITTYHGVATEWLPHEIVDRSTLGPGGSGEPAKQADIERLECGHVALLKGELWTGNEDAGLVHRSPAVPDGENRLLLTLDVSN